MEKHFCPYCMTPVPEGESCPACGLTAGTYTPSPHHLPPGTVLMDRYMVGRVLGEGGFGITYIGCDLRLELKVAIKEYYPVDRATRNCSASIAVTSFMGASASAYERGKQKFLDEARIMARMDKQPEIVSVRDHFEANNTAYIVMEYVEGTNFKDLVAQKGGRIPAKELLPLIEPLFKALSLMHENGLIHRDISPDNLMIENGKVRLLDFGCARDSAGGNETLTIALKHGYAPLEQYQQKGQGPWTDIYALSATIYYCLTGRVPPQALDRIAEDDLILPRKLGVDLTEKQEKALLRGLEIRPNRRFQTADELHAALYAAEEPPIVEPPMPMPCAPAPRIMYTAEKTQTVSVPQSKETKQEQQKKPKKQKPKRKNTLLWSAIGTTAAVAVILLAIFIPRLMPPDIEPVSNSLAADTDGAGSSQEDVQDGDPFENAYELSGPEVDEEMIRAALLNMEYSAVILGDSVSVSIEDSALSLNKPLLIKEGASLRLHQTATIGLKGSLRVEGELIAAGVIRMMGSKAAQLDIAETGRYHNDGLAILWMENESGLHLAAGAEMDQDIQLLTVSEEKLFENATEVFSLKELLDAAEDPDTSSIIIRPPKVQLGRQYYLEMTLMRPLTFTCPVKIDEKVLMNAPVDADGNSCGISLSEEAVLINHGTIAGALNLSDSAAVLNYGNLLMDTDHEGSALWMENGTLINTGHVDAYNCSRIWDGTMYNIGELNAYDFYLVGGDMVNTGTVQVQSSDVSLDNGANLTLNNRSRLLNFGELTVHKNSGIYNGGYIQNWGSLIQNIDSSFLNAAILENRNLFTVRQKAEFVWPCTGIILNSGTIDSAADLGEPTYPLIEDITGGGEVMEAADDAALAAGLKDRSIDAVWVTGDVTLKEDTVVTKPLCITEGASLTLENGAKLRADGGKAVIYVQGHARLQGSAFSFTDNAQLYLYEDAAFALDKGGTLSLDASLCQIWGEFSAEEGSIAMTGRAVVNCMSAVSDGLSSLSIREGSVFNANGNLDLTACELDIQDGGVMNCLGDTVMTQTYVGIQDGGLYNSGKNFSLVSCNVVIGEDGSHGEFSHMVSDVTVNASTIIINYDNGNMDINGWDEHSFVLEGTLINHGQLRSWAPMTISGRLDNQGEINYNAYQGIRVEGGSLTGNDPIAWE